MRASGCFVVSVGFLLANLDSMISLRYVASRESVVASAAELSDGFLVAGSDLRFWR
jgi:hypothetical protein